jgi:hypothetical protein
LFVLLYLSLAPALVTADEPFPFGETLILDAAPMRGSKRIPMLEIAEDGAASIDLWCASARAQAVVADHSISIGTADLQNAQCDPDRQSRDAELLAALVQVTNWRRNGDIVELLGATPLRFRLMTN